MGSDQKLDSDREKETSPTTATTVTTKGARARLVDDDERDLRSALLRFPPRLFSSEDQLITHSGVTARHLLVGETVHPAPPRLQVTRGDLRRLFVALTGCTEG